MGSEFSMTDKSSEATELPVAQDLAVSEAAAGKLYIPAFERLKPALERSPWDGKDRGHEQ